jgi:hypothetical protein
VDKDLLLLIFIFGIEGMNQFVLKGKLFMGPSLELSFKSKFLKEISKRDDVTVKEFII